MELAIGHPVLNVGIDNMTPEQTIEERIKQASDDLGEALLENIRANKKVIESQAEKTASRFKVLKARQRLSSLEEELLSYN